jgi:cell division septum initiation protein DivIVA
MTDLGSNQTYEVSQGDARYDTAQKAVTALSEMAKSIDDLRDRMDPAIAAVHHALVISTSEVEIGKLFARAQDFIDQAVAEAQQKAAQLLVDARREAERIVAAGHRHAAQLVEQARASASAPVEVIQQLERTIESFNRSNSELANQLAYLRSSLATTAAASKSHNQSAAEPQLSLSPPQAPVTHMAPPIAAPSVNGYGTKAG